MDAQACMAVGALIVRDGEEVLVGQPAQDAPVALPGGPVALGESLVAALERSLGEILGLPCSVGPYLGAIEHHDEVGVYTLQHIFRVDLDQSNGVALARVLPDGRRFGWCKADGLPAANLQPASLQRLISLYINWDRSPWWATNIAP